MGSSNEAAISHAEHLLRIASRETIHESSKEKFRMPVRRPILWAVQKRRLLVQRNVLSRLIQATCKANLPEFGSEARLPINLNHYLSLDQRFQITSFGRLSRHRHSG